MTGNTFGESFKIVTFGESHGKAVGVVVDGLKPGLEIDVWDVQKELDLRKPGKSKAESARAEEDKVEILSGVMGGKTLGTPLCMIIWNKDVKSSDYEAIKDKFRPGHAGYTYFKKYGVRDYRGGGRASGRETAARVAAGAIAKKELADRGILVKANAVKIGSADVSSFSEKEIEDHILRYKKNKESIGGIVECVVEGVPAGLGEPVFAKLDAEIAKALMSVGSVKGVEIGAGFKAAEMTGSECNDEFYVDKSSLEVKTKTNNSGGILGGISNGMPIVARVAVKPTASIPKEQDTVNEAGREVKISVEGRHDPCICLRIVPVVEAMMAIVVYDALVRQEKVNQKV